MYKNWKHHSEKYTITSVIDKWSVSGDTYMCSVNLILDIEVCIFFKLFYQEIFINLINIIWLYKIINTYLF